MNLFSKALLVILATLYCFNAFSLNLTAVYTSACKRELGIIIHVDDQYIQYLNLDAQVINLRPHEVIFLAYYPIDQLPISEEINFSKAPAFKVRTQEGTEIKELVTGWPIGFTKDKVSFLTPQGRENMINRQNMFSLEYVTINKVHFDQVRKNFEYTFVHPHVFRECPLEKNKTNKIMKVYPQQ
ncbi:MAG: hypothetical protein KDD40_03240, partial [Bdellovibrionales bacterium]|nr:hypothetical protein [Bdellovibrionales bacterium]